MRKPRVNSYKVVAVLVLLYGSETWVPVNIHLSSEDAILAICLRLRTKRFSTMETFVRNRTFLISKIVLQETREMDCSSE